MALQESDDMAEKILNRHTILTELLICMVSGETFDAIKNHLLQQK